MGKFNVVVLFGGRSTEHEISIISATQVLNALNKEKYNVIPLYISKKGEWVKGDTSFFKAETFKNLEKAVEKKKFQFIAPSPEINYLVDKPGSYNFLKGVVKEKIDIVLPIFHGRFGEDGSVQGLFEFAGLAYAGCNVQASAIGMDKMVSKRVAQAIGVPVLPGNWIGKVEWAKSRSKSLDMVMKGLKYPVFVKPVHLGSSIGVTRASNKKELENALEVGFYYDTKVLVEQGLVNAMEVNISLLGNNPYEFSATEKPVASSEVLSFEDKYISKDDKPSKGMATLKRIIPAPIKKTTEDKIKEYADRFFAEIGGEGIVRMDFLLTKDEKHIYLNEINTMPGSLAFYLWEKTGVTFSKLLDKLIDLGLARKDEEKKLNYTFKSNVLGGYRGGVKGKKF
ncbi:MAG TPA: D-alanine--D-alanine ligase family protein [Patescibacteria group bacterium]